MRISGCRLAIAVSYQAFPVHRTLVPSYNRTFSVNPVSAGASPLKPRMPIRTSLIALFSYTPIVIPESLSTEKQRRGGRHCGHRYTRPFAAIRAASCQRVHEWPDHLTGQSVLIAKPSVRQVSLGIP